MELRDKWMQETESKQQTKTKRINEATIETCYTENQRHNMRTNAIPNQKNIVTVDKKKRVSIVVRLMNHRHVFPNEIISAFYLIV